MRDRITTQQGTDVDNLWTRRELFDRIPPEQEHRPETNEHWPPPMPGDQKDRRERQFKNARRCGKCFEQCSPARPPSRLIGTGAAANAEYGRNDPRRWTYE